MLRTLYILYIFMFLKSIKKSIHNIKHKFNGFCFFIFWCVLSTLKEEGGVYKEMGKEV